MQRYIHHLNRIRSDIAAHPEPEAQTSHRQLLNHYIAAACAEPEVDIPFILHRSGLQEIKRVNDITIRRLVQGKTIARTVRYLIPQGAGNQRLQLMHSNGFNRPITEAAQVLAKLHPGISWGANSALIAGGGNCREHADVTFAIARSLGLPVALLANHTADHAFAVLYPSTADAVVMDPWTIFPSSCLLSDSAFSPDKVVDSYHPDQPIPADFNLHYLARLQQRLDQDCGSNTLQQIFTEKHRQFHGIGSDLLDKMLLDQGLLHYYQLPHHLHSAQGQAEIEEMQRQLTEKIFYHSANRVGITSAFTELPPAVSLGNTGTTLQRSWAKNKALVSARVATQTAALTEASRLALEGANQSADRCHTASITTTTSHTEMKGLGIATVDYTATVTSQAKPMLWDTLTHGPNILYQSTGQGNFSTIKAPQSLINDMQIALTRAQQRDFPDSQRRTPPPRSHRNTSRAGIEGALRHACMNTISQALTQFGALHDQQPSPPDRARQELQMLKIIDDRFDDASARIKIKVLMNMANLLVDADPANLELAVTYWVAWQQRTLSEDPADKASQLFHNTWEFNLANKQVEPVLRRGALQVIDAADLFDTAALHLTNPAMNRDTILAVMHDTLSHIRDSTKLAAAQARLDSLILAYNPIDSVTMQTTMSQWDLEVVQTNPIQRRASP
jgi:hypothetical protein